MNDIYDIRRANLRGLLEAKAQGKQANLALHLDVPPNLVSRWLSGKHIGDDVARGVEQVFDLPYGAMDRLSIATDQPPAVQSPDSTLTDSSETALSRLINNWFASDADGRAFIEQAAKFAATLNRTEGGL